MREPLLSALALVWASVVVSVPTWAGDCTADLPQVKAWTLDYTFKGGKAGVDRHLLLTTAGDLSVGNFERSDDYSSHVVSHASRELQAQIAEFFTVARTEPPLEPPSPDQYYASLTVTSAGTECRLEVTQDLAKLLNATMDAVLSKALVGTWRQSAWKLCHPVPQLTAEDYDPPIQELLFRDDGSRFSVTWQGGGARVYGGSDKPHEALPDYSGRYQIAPAYSYIQMRFEGGIFTPRDFSGDGHYRINGDELVLQNIWLGTYKASKKPDICELIFKRVPKTGLGHETTHR